MRVLNYCKAGYPVLWVSSVEESRAIDEIIAELSGDYQVWGWDLVNGLRLPDGSLKACKSPIDALMASLGMSEGSVLIYKDASRLWGGIEAIRTLKNLIPILKGSDRHIVVVSPVLGIADGRGGWAFPPELERDICVLYHDLPDVDALQAVAAGVVRENNLSIDVTRETAAAGKGLTADECENAVALSIIDSGGVSRGALESAKLQAVKKSGLAEIVSPVDPSELVMPGLMEYIEKRVAGFRSPSVSRARPAGVLLVGLPGGGKSLSVQVIAHVLGVPLLRVDISSLRGSLVGQSEERMRSMLSLVRAVAGESGAVVWLDEIEKSLGGVQSSSRTDGGTGASMFGALLTAMQDWKSQGVPVFWAATCNDISELLAISQGALLRRFDDVFFVDLPSLSERELILAIMNKRYNTEVNGDTAKRCEGWTGAEIEKLCVTSIYEGVQAAYSCIHPIYEQNKESIDRAREWARVNARRANGVETVVIPTGRKIRGGV